VQEGDRIAQLIIEKIETPEVFEVEVRVLIFSEDTLMRCIASLQDLGETLRGANGFGSTGGHAALCSPP
jgi:dUTP pyrophosphatase